MINTSYNYKKILSCNDIEQELSDISSNASSNPYIVLHEAAIILKEAPQSSTGIETPLNPYYITFEKAKDVVPNIVTQFLEFFIGKANKSTTRILSIAQDLIFVTSNGRSKTSKHVGLAFSMKNYLRAKTHISALNRLGACISYDDLMRIDTKWADDILEEGDEYATLPSNVKPDIFLQVTFDNADYGQESNSQHITNIVIYQCPIGSFSEDTVTYVTKEKKKSRRRSVCTSASKAVNFQPDATKIPEYYKNVCLEELKYRELSNKRITMNHINKDCVLKRMVSAKYFSLSDVAVIPERTPFHKTMCFKLNFPKITENCRSYPAPPTSMTNFYTVLLNIKKMFKKIGVSSYIVSCDEAVHHICKEIQWKTKNEFDDMVFRLGGFHIAKNFLGVIGT